MKLPAVAIAVAFAGGILLGRQARLQPPDVTQRTLVVPLATVFVLLVIAVFFAMRNKLWPAAIISLFCWAGLAKRPDTLSLGIWNRARAFASRNGTGQDAGRRRGAGKLHAEGRRRRAPKTPCG